VSRRRYSRSRRALLVGALTLAIYPFPRFSLPAQGAPRGVAGSSGKIVAKEIVHALPARSTGELSRPAVVPSGVSAGSTGGDTLLYTSPVVDAGQVFDFVGVHWIAARAAQDSLFIEFRTSGDGLGWSDWTTVTQNDHMRNDDRNELFAGPYAVTAARHAQYRVWLSGGDPDAIGQIALTLMDVNDLNAGPLARLLNGVRGAVAQMWRGSYAEAAPAGAVKINTRQDWGADESLMKWAAKYQPVQKVVVHHTVTDDGGNNVAASIRSIYYFHAVTRGWGDIGYNYLVDKFGTIWAGRSGGDHVIAGHAYGWNNGSIGVAAIGDYSTKAPTPALQNAVVSIIAMKAKQFGFQPLGADPFTHQEQAANGTWVNVTSNAPNLQGHRDANYIVSQHGGQTACPGNGIYNNLDVIRRSSQDGVQAGFFQLPYIEPNMPKAAFPGAATAVGVTVFNRGATPIPAGTGLSYRMLKDGVVTTQGAVVPLPDIAPNGSGTASLQFVPPAVGNYTVRWDLQTSGQWWSSLYNTPVRDVAFRSADWSVDWVKDNVPINWTAGEMRIISVTATNDGGRVWPANGANPVRLGYKWVSNSTGNTFPGANKAPLAVDVQPGQTVNLVIPITAPVYPTNYTLYIDLYKENEFVFAEKGVAPDDTPTGVSVDFKAAYNVPVGGVLSAPVFTAGQTVTVPVIVTNSGNGVFPTNSSFPVNLGYHWYDSAGRAVVWDGARTKLPADLGPGQSVTLQATVAAPADPGTYSLRFDLVQEGVSWFSLKGSAPTDFTVNVAGQLVPAYGAAYSSGLPSAAIAGTNTSVPIIVTNNGNFPWLAGGANPVTLSYHWMTPAGATVVWDGLRTKLAADLQPGQSVQLAANLAFPAAAGLYVLKWDLVHEGVSWFSGKGVPASAKQVEVSPNVEPFYGGAFIVDDVPASLAPKITTTVPIKVFNLSNFDWGSDVNLSYHWYDASGKSVVWDGMRTSLAGMKKGEVRIVQMQITTPSANGTYVMKPDIVREGVTWFSDRGMMLPSRSIVVDVPMYGATYQTQPNFGAAVGAITTVPITIQNNGSATWQPGAFNLSYHLYAAGGNVYVWDGLRTALPVAVPPGSSVTVDAIVRTPSVAGAYTAAFDLVQEGVTWFSTRNVPTGSSTLQAQ